MIVSGGMDKKGEKRGKKGLTSRYKVVISKMKK